MTDTPAKAPLPSWSDMLKTALVWAWKNKPYVISVVVATTGVWASLGHVPAPVWAIEAALSGASIHSSIVNS